MEHVNLTSLEGYCSRCRTDQFDADSPSDDVYPK